MTATVENLSLIASSIMSKKLAAGSDAILLDVKCGKGAFMKSEEDAKALAELMCKIGSSQGKKTAAIISDMSEPLGHAVGNSLEVIEAIELLKGNIKGDLLKLCLNISAAMIYLGGGATGIEEGFALAENAISSGRALQKLAEMIEYQGGNKLVIDDYSLFPKAEIYSEIKVESSGYIESIDAEYIGLASQHSGAGRASKDDEIDHSAGIRLLAKRGDKLEPSDTIAIVYSSDEKKLKQACDEVLRAYTISDCEPKSEPLIRTMIGL